jgi:hypothetical protein
MSARMSALAIFPRGTSPHVNRVNVSRGVIASI